METISLRPYFLIAALLLFTACNRFHVKIREPIDYVNPYIGSIGHLLTATTPDVQMPRGMVRLLPLTTPGIRDTYLADEIYGFSVRSLSNDFSVGDFVITIKTGNLKTDPGENASHFDHDHEIATPYYYSVRLDDSDINAEYTVSDHSADFQVYIS